MLSRSVVTMNLTRAAVSRRPLMSQDVPTCVSTGLLATSTTTASIAFSALIGRQEEHPACKHWVVRCWRGYLSGVRCKRSATDATATPSSLASLKSRLVWHFWCQLTQIVLRPLNRCLSVYYCYCYWSTCSGLWVQANSASYLRGTGKVRVSTNLELSGNFVNLEKSGNLRYGQGIFYDIVIDLLIDELIFACNV